MELTPNKYMRDNLTLRDFQQEGIWFLLNIKKGILAFSTGLGKTVTILSTFSYIKSVNPKAFLLYITEKTIIDQSMGDCTEYFKFKPTAIYDMSAAKRTKAFKDASKHSNVLFTNYAQLIWSEQELLELFDTIGADNIVLAFDEATRIKGSTSQTAMIARGMSKVASNVVLSTATPSKGKLEDFFNLTKTLGHNLLSQQDFIERFVVYEKTFNLRIKKGQNFIAFGKGVESNGRVSFIFKYKTSKEITKKPKIGSISPLNKAAGVWKYTIKDYSEYTVDSIHFGEGVKEETIALHMSFGYKTSGYKNLSKFKKIIDPYIFIKSKQDVAKELPPYTTETMWVDESKETKQSIKDLYEEYEGNPNYASLYIATSTIESNKYKTLLDMLEYTFNLEEDKVIVYTPYKSLIKAMQADLIKKGYKVAAIHGDLKQAQREAEKAKFNDDYQIILINDAGNQGLNLQVSGNVVFYNMPLLYGDYQQTAGRISRIGTKHSKLNLYFLITGDTIDQDIFEGCFMQGQLIKRINPKLIEEGALVDIVSGELEADKMELFIKKTIKNRRKQYQ